MLTVAEYAKARGVTRSYVHRMVRLGRLAAVRAYGRWMIEAGAQVKASGGRYRDIAGAAPSETEAMWEMIHRKEADGGLG